MLLVLNDFSSMPGSNNLKVILCERLSDKVVLRWLEFIDRDSVEGYVSQYDVGNFSKQIIKTRLSKLKFPNGVAVEEFAETDQSMQARQKLKVQMPPAVREMMEQRELMEEYTSLVDAFSRFCMGKYSQWDTEKIRQVALVHTPKFEAKGVTVFISHKQELVRTPKPGDEFSSEFFELRWIEFVDRARQPNYYAQRGIQFKPARYLKKDHAVLAAEVAATVAFAVLSGTQS